MDWAYVLVIILSATLALFLLLAIVLIILLIRVTLQIKKVTDSAQNTASTIENMVSNVSTVARPLVLGQLLLKKAKKFNKRKDKKDES